MSEEFEAMVKENARLEAYIAKAMTALLSIEPHLSPLQESFKHLLTQTKMSLECPRCHIHFKTEESIEEHYSFTNHRMTSQQVRDERIEEAELNTRMRMKFVRGR